MWGNVSEKEEEEEEKESGSENEKVNIYNVKAQYDSILCMKQWID